VDVFDVRVDVFDVRASVCQPTNSSRSSDWWRRGATRQLSGWRHGAARRIASVFTSRRLNALAAQINSRPCFKFIPSSVADRDGTPFGPSETLSDA